MRIIISYASTSIKAVIKGHSWYCSCCLFLRSSRQSTPQFSPVASLRGSPETGLGPSEEWERLLEDDIKKWVAQLVLALEHLHSSGIICR